nr:hypothetical protein [Tanacetum cinerariifolium]
MEHIPFIWTPGRHFHSKQKIKRRQTLNGTNSKPTDPNPKQHNLNPKTSSIFTNTSFGKPSFVSVVNGSSLTGDSNIPTKIRSISLKDQYLTSDDECEEKKVDAPENAKSVDDLDDLLNDLNENKVNHEDIPLDVNEPLNKKCDTRGVGDEKVVVGECVVVASSSLKMLANSCLGGIMVSLIFLEGLEEEALMEFMVEWFEEDENGKNNGNEGLFNLKA